MFSSEAVISGVDDWTMWWVVSVLVELQMMATVQNVSLCLCVCFSSECGGRRTWGRIEKDEKVENGHTLEAKRFIHVFAESW